MPGRHERCGDWSGVVASWFAEMCASILRRVRSRSSGETLLRSVSNPARTIDLRSFGLIFSSSSTDQIFGAPMFTRHQARCGDEVQSQSAKLLQHLRAGEFVRFVSVIGA